MTRRAVMQGRKIGRGPTTIWFDSRHNPLERLRDKLINDPDGLTPDEEAYLARELAAQMTQAKLDVDGPYTTLVKPWDQWYQSLDPHIQSRVDRLTQLVEKSIT